MHSLNEIKEKSIKNNIENQNRLMFFSSKFSIYFTWIFVNLGISANQVTGIFFITGTIGALCSFKFSLFTIVLSYILYRLHIIFDICDGEVARFDQTFSMNGAYFDYMVHALVYPLYFFGMGYATYIYFSNDFFIVLGGLGSILISLMLAVKNNYFRAMLFNNLSIDDWKNKSNSNSKNKSLMFNFISAVMSFESFFFLYIVLFFVQNETLYQVLFLAYMIFFSLVGIVKFIGLAKKGYYNTRI